MNDRSSRSRFEWMSPWLEMCGCITPFALSWQKAGHCTINWADEIIQLKVQKGQKTGLLFCFAVSMFLTDSSEWCSMLGICCSFTLKLLKQCFSFVSQNIYTRYTKNLGGEWLETPPWNCRHSNFPEDTKQGPRTNYCTVLLTFDCRKVIFSSSKMSHITAKY